MTIRVNYNIPIQYTTRYCYKNLVIDQISNLLRDYFYNLHNLFDYLIEWCPLHFECLVCFLFFAFFFNMAPDLKFLPKFQTMEKLFNIYDAFYILVRYIAG